MSDKKTFTITCPPGSIILTIGLGIVYDWHVAFITLGMLFVIGTIWENLSK